MQLCEITVILIKILLKPLIIFLFEFFLQKNSNVESRVLFFDCQPRVSVAACVVVSSSADP